MKSKLPTEGQEKCIALLKKHPGDGFAMFGPSGTSKTTYTVALYRECLKTNYETYRTVVRIKAKTLLDVPQQSKVDDNFDVQRQRPYLGCDRRATSPFTV